MAILKFQTSSLCQNGGKSTEHPRLKHQTGIASSLNHEKTVPHLAEGKATHHPGKYMRIRRDFISLCGVIGAFFGVAVFPPAKALLYSSHASPVLRHGLRQHHIEKGSPPLGGFHE